MKLFHNGHSNATYDYGYAAYKLLFTINIIRATSAAIKAITGLRLLYAVCVYSFVKKKEM
jgi:hypothetical protein